VVVEAERGDVPAYLTKVEALPWEPAAVAAGAGATLRAALTGDWPHALGLVGRRVADPGDGASGA